MKARFPWTLIYAGQIASASDMTDDQKNASPKLESQKAYVHNIRVSQNSHRTVLRDVGA